MSSMRYALAALLGAQLAAATSYDLAKDYSGSGFFDDWNFYDNCTWSWSSMLHALRTSLPSQSITLPTVMQRSLARLTRPTHSSDARYRFIGADSSLKLAYVDSNNRAIMKVDNSSTVPYNEKRSTVRIASKDSYEVGNLWVADMYHVPYGVSSSLSVWSVFTHCGLSARYGQLSGLRLPVGRQVARLIPSRV